MARKPAGRASKKTSSTSGYQRKAGQRSSTYSKFTKRYPMKSSPRPMRSETAKAYQDGFLGVVSEGPGGTKNMGQTPYARQYAAEHYFALKNKTARKPRKVAKKSSSARNTRRGR